MKTVIEVYPYVYYIKLLPLCLKTLYKKWWLSHFPDGSASKESIWNSGATGDVGLIPGLARALGEENSNPLQYSCIFSAFNTIHWYWVSIGKLLLLLVSGLNAWGTWFFSCRFCSSSEKKDLIWNFYVASILIFFREFMDFLNNNNPPLPPKKQSYKRYLINWMSAIY